MTERGTVTEEIEIALKDKIHELQCQLEQAEQANRLLIADLGAANLRLESVERIFSIIATLVKNHG